MSGDRAVPVSTAAAPCDAAPGEGAFALAADGGWTFAGSLTFDNAATVMAQCEALPLPRHGRIDIGGLAVADSSALAVLLALKRRGTAERHKVHFENFPESLASLGRVYGLEDLIAA
jgi:phospholipid transport system transporter-binding protein